MITTFFCYWPHINICLPYLEWATGMFHVSNVSQCHNSFHIYDQDTHCMWLSMWKRGFQTMCTRYKLPYSAVRSCQNNKKKTLLSFIARLLAGLPEIITLKNSVSTQPVYKVSSFQFFFCKLNFYRVVSIFLSFFKVLKEIFPLGEKKLSFSSVTGKLLRFLNDR